MPIRKVSVSNSADSLLVQRINGVSSGKTKVRRVVVGKPISSVVQTGLGANIKSFDGLGDTPSINDLSLGELGINTKDGKLYIKREYDEGIQSIVEIGSGTAGDNLSATTTFNSYIFTSDGTLEIVTGADDVGNVLQYDPDSTTASRIQIYLNGVLLQPGIDYVADTGDSISLTHVVDAEMVIQIAAYNSTGVSFGNDLILDDHFSFTVGTNEETRFYHNGTDTAIKHMGFDNSKFKIQHLNDDRFILDDSGVQLLGNYTLNGNTIATQTELNQINTRLDSLDSDILVIPSASPSASGVFGDFSIDTNLVTTSGNMDPIVVDTIPLSDFRTSRYTIQVSNTSTMAYQSNELLLVHDGVEVYTTSYGELHTGAFPEASIDVNIVGTNMVVTISPNSTDSYEFKSVRHSVSA